MIFEKAALIKKKGTDPDLLLRYVKALKNSLEFSCLNPQDWAVRVEDEGEYIRLSIDCIAEKSEKYKDMFGDK
jgi:hypothetical protein